MAGIQMEKGNVVRIVDSKEKAEALKAQGFTEKKKGGGAGGESGGTDNSGGKK